MYDYRLFFPQMSVEERTPVRRPISGHGVQRIHRLAVERRPARQARR